MSKMNPTFGSDSSSLEAEYLQLRRLLYEKFFTYMIYTLLASMVIESTRAFIHMQIGTVVLVTFCVGFCVLLNQFIRTLKNHQEFIITAFFVIFYFIATAVQYYGDGWYFKHPLDAFYFGCTNVLFDRLVATRMPKLSYRIFWSVASALVRIVIVPFNDKGMLASQIVMGLGGILLDIDRESHDHNMFKFYFDSKDQLLKFKNLVDDIPGEIAIISRDLMQCLFANKAFHKLTGVETNKNIHVQAQLDKFSLQELESENHEMSHPRTLRTILEKHLLESTDLSQKYSCNLSYFNLTPSGEDNRRTFEAKIFGITWDGQQAIAIVLTDLTQQKTIFDLKTANTHKDAILATVSHELRTPLNAMLGAIQIMQKHITDNQMMHYLRICKNNGDLLLSLVNSILDSNQIATNKLKLNNEEINLREILHETLSLFEFQCHQKGLDLRLEVAPDAPKLLITDKNRLKQILINLIGNAIKFTSEGGIIISVNLSDADNDYISFSIKDTGIGIQDTDRSKLFRVFGKIEQESTNMNRQGVGLGLTISNSLAILLCDDKEEAGIKVESEFSKGSTFTFLIRRNLEEQEINRSLSSVPTQHVSEDIQTNVLSHLTLPRKRPLTPFKTKSVGFLQPQRTFDFFNSNSNNSVLLAKMPTCQEFRYNSVFENKGNAENGMLPYVLIVDDNPFNIAVAESLVKCHGYKVKSALSGRIAIDMMLANNYEKDPIRLILMDCQMPIMDGYETTKNLITLMKSRKIPKITIVPLTANDSEEDKKACREAGMCDHLSKPLQDVELVRVLRKYGRENL